MTRRGISGLVAVVLLVLAGCGVPTGGAPRTIAPSDVPYALSSPTPGAGPTSAPQTMLDASQVYLVAPDDTLVPRPRDVPAGDTEEQLTELLADLAGGPTTEERDQQLSTALPPDVELDVAEAAGATVTIDIAVPAEAPSGWASRRAVAQIVLTATSLPEVRSVLLRLAGVPIEAPLPGGELTARPLTAADYEVFLTAPTPAATPAPPPPVAPSADPPSGVAPPSATPSPTG